MSKSVVVGRAVGECAVCRRSLISLAAMILDPGKSLKATLESRIYGSPFLADLRPPEKFKQRSEFSDQPAHFLSAASQYSRQAIDRNIGLPYDSAVGAYVRLRCLCPTCVPTTPFAHTAGPKATNQNAEAIPALIAFIAPMGLADDLQLQVVTASLLAVTYPAGHYLLNDYFHGYYSDVEVRRLAEGTRLT